MRFVRTAVGVLVGILLVGVAGVEVIGNPQIFEIRINEVFSNSDGTMQFVELWATAEYQGDLGPMQLQARNPDGTFRNMILDFVDSVPAWHQNNALLLATQKVSDTLGFAADFQITDGSIPLHDGRVVLMTDAGTIVDAIAYGNFSGSNYPYGTPAVTLPCDGFKSLTLTHLVVGARNNVADYSLQTNSPMRIDSTFGQIGPLVNTPPQLSNIGPRFINEGGLILVNDTAMDCNGMIPTMSANMLPPGATYTDFGGGVGRLEWFPTYTQAGTYPVHFTASDGVDADSEIVIITVNSVTDPPVARDTLFTLDEDASLLGQLPAWDPDTDPLVYAILSGPSHGGISGLDSNTGAFTYSPYLHYFGPDTIRFRVRDPWVNSNTATVAFSVAHVNVPPTANSTTYLVKLSTPLAIGPMPVTDVDNPTWTVTQTYGPFHGQVSAFDPASGAFLYTPATGYLGPDSIRYFANDGLANSNNAMIRLTISTGCDCSLHGDPITDGALDVFDVISAIGAAFSGQAVIIDPTCPHAGREDFNCDCAIDVFDVIGFIEAVFSGGQGPCNPCASPCS
jgi:hypothetical protein